VPGRLPLAKVIVRRADALALRAVGIETLLAANATRQSPHILMASSRPDEPLYIQCLPSSFATTRSIALFTPNGLLQRMQQNGSSSLRMRAGARAARKSILGFSAS